MIQGHGDDRYRFQREIRADFSSNVFGHVDLEPLFAQLRNRLGLVGRYPEPEPWTLEAELAAREGIDPTAVCVTSGATEAIYLTAHAFAPARSTILAPTFSEYADACRLYAHSVALVSVLLPKKGRFTENHPPLRSLMHSENESEPSAGPDSAENRAVRWPGGAFSVPFASARSKRVLNAPQQKPGLIWLCNPNNPTGSVVPKEILERQIVDNPDTIFVIDQSYGFFTKEPLLTAAESARYSNVLQLHSMTKRYAMPGLRLGYVTGCPELIDRLRAVRMPWSVNALAIEAGRYLCAHPDTAPIDLDGLLQETQRLRKDLNDIPGLTAEPTQTHFFLCRLAEGSAAELKQWLAEKHGILIRDAANFEGLDAGCFRIATQTPEENQLLVDAIRHYKEAGR